MGGMNLSYSYNADGQRTSKSRSAYYTDEYVYYGTQLSTLIRNGVGYKHSLTFIYDDNGQALGFYYDTNLNDSNPGTKYYYVCNAQGDVLQLRDHTNAPVANYYYDSWGKLLGITDANGNAITAFNSVAVFNPIRYRGYFYDTETGFYYLNSRYYDPEIGRFINADDVDVLDIDQGSFLQYNLYAYCLNNPVNMVDTEGYAASNIIGGILGGASGATLGYLLADILGLKGWKKWALISAATVGGAVLGAFLGPYVAKLTKYIASSVKTTVKTVVKQAPKSLCFVAGTLVESQNGHIPIETVKVGDYVYAENPETGEKALKQVVQTFVNQTDELVHVKVDNQTISATPNHPFYSPEKGWVEAVDLRADDRLILRSGEIVIVEDVQFEVLETPVTVYNFEVEDFHTYYVTSSSVLVHNLCAKEFIKSPKNARQVLSYLKDQGFKTVRQNGSHIKLVKGSKTVIVPNHGGKDIAIGTLKSIMKQAGLL